LNTISNAFSKPGKDLKGRQRRKILVLSLLLFVLAGAGWSVVGLIVASCHEPPTEEEMVSHPPVGTLAYARWVLRMRHHLETNLSEGMTYPESEGILPQGSARLRREYAQFGSLYTMTLDYPELGVRVTYSTELVERGVVPTTSLLKVELTPSEELFGLVSRNSESQ
jgi:hypothetical protein